MKSNEQQQINQTNSMDALSQEKTNKKKNEDHSTPKDGFRYDYDDSSDL